MAVAFDNAAVANDFGVTTITTASFTIAGTNRAAVIGIGMTPRTISAVSCACGGVSGTAIASATGSNVVADLNAQCWQVIAPATGTQTATASWTTAASGSVEVTTFQGVDQTTPCTNGTGSTGGASPQSLAVTSTSGDLTTTCAMTDRFDSAQTTNQTRKNAGFASTDIGPGTGNTTHTWTEAGAFFALAGANVKAVAAGGATLTWSPAITMTGFQ